MTNIPIKTHVECSDGFCGQSTQVVVNPINKKVTHLVVESRHFTGSHTRIVPVGKVAKITQEKITLNCTKADMENMPPFVVANFIQESSSGRAYESQDVYSYQYVINDTGYDEIDEENIPDGELALYRGMQVQATDAKVGKLDELVLDSDSGNITHILMREGHLWDKKDVVIPVSAVDICDADTIFLNIDKDAVSALPTVKTKKAA